MEFRKLDKTIKRLSMFCKISGHVKKPKTSKLKSSTSQKRLILGSKKQKVEIRDVNWNCITRLVNLSTNFLQNFDQTDLL